MKFSEPKPCIYSLSGKHGQSAVFNYYKAVSNICFYFSESESVSSLAMQKVVEEAIPHKNIETNEKFYRKVAFLMYTEMVNFRP